MVYKVKNLSKKFGKKYVLKNIDLEVAENEKIVIIGPSGSGKSTFLRCLNTLRHPVARREPTIKLNPQRRELTVFATPGAIMASPFVIPFI